MTFNELNISSAILKALDKENYKAPTPIQAQAIPAILSGRDFLGCAQTGTGKTAAFAIPTIQLLNEHPPKPGMGRRIRSLILSPTRELALQIYDNVKAYSQFTKLRAAAILGGVSQKTQERSLQQGADIIIATPGRLLDLMNQRRIDLQYVEILVLDEADRMLDMGFIHDVKRIIAKMPSKKQTLFFSATMPAEINQLVKTLLIDPVKVEITPVSSTAERIKQEVYLLDKGHKQKQLNEILKDESIVSALVFTRTKRGADRVVRDLTKVNISAQAIHGDKSQISRQNALKNFKSGETRVLVATDIAARGIDIDELSHVVNFNLPNIPETYVHRIGRTGRAGLSGTAISFCEVDELPFLKDIEKLIGKTIPEVTDHAYPMPSSARFSKAKGSSPKSSAKPSRAKSDSARRPRTESVRKSKTESVRNTKTESVRKTNTESVRKTKAGAALKTDAGRMKTSADRTSKSDTWRKSKADTDHKPERKSERQPREYGGRKSSNPYSSRKPKNSARSS